MINLEAATGVEGRGIVNHLQNEGPSSTHLDFTHIEAKPEEGFEERAFAVGLAAEGNDFWYRELLSEGDGGRLEAVVGLEPGGASGGGVCGGELVVAL